MIDPFHLDAYGVTTVNYNRDVEAFPLVRTILARITGDDQFYRSPTDMGVNMAGYAIVDDAACREASCQEVIRRYYKGLTDLKMGREKQETVDKLVTIMQQLGIKESDRVAAMVEELFKFGIRSIIEDNAVEICSDRLKTHTEMLGGHNDHRIVMALSLLCSMVGGAIEGAEAVAKSYPDYFSVIRSLGIEVIGDDI